MSWWNKLLNRQSEMQAEAHNQAMDQPFVYPEADTPPALSLTERIAQLEERVAVLEQILLATTADS